MYTWFCVVGNGAGGRMAGAHGAHLCFILAAYIQSRISPHKFSVCLKMCDGDGVHSFDDRRLATLAPICYVYHPMYTGHMHVAWICAYVRMFVCVMKIESLQTTLFNVPERHAT